MKEGASKAPSLFLRESKARKEEKPKKNQTKAESAEGREGAGEETNIARI
jgi:hypothetical protein